MKRPVKFFLLLILAYSNLFAQRGQSNLKEYFSRLRDNQQFNGNILVAEKGQLVYEQSFGYADFANKTLNSTNTVFPIASLSKTITATGILQLEQSGKLKISDPVIKYLKEFPYPTITVKHLLSHTSGLPAYNAFFDSLKEQQPGRVFKNSDFIRGLVTNKKPLIYQPGERGNYDNINYIVLALLIEEISGISYSDYIEKYVLKPAGMFQTTFYGLAKQYAASGKSNFAFPHIQPHLYSDTLVKANTVPYIVSYWTAYDFNGFGDYISTIHDLLKYDQAYYNGSLLDSKKLEEVFTPVKLNNGLVNPLNIGLGWLVDKDTSLGKIVYHSGAATGLSCVLVRNISRHQTIIVYDNAHYNAYEIAMNAMKILNGIPVPSPKKSVARIYARLLLKYGAGAARDTVNRLIPDTLNYRVSEYEINLLGYDFMGGVNNPNPYRFPEEHKYAEAIETFKLNTELFPESWNVYDSYGEALVVVGRKEEAIKMYRKSIELNPKNEGGKKALELLIK
jgi:CubicO group peptidase (beta-lactamase class C family)